MDEEKGKWHCRRTGPEPGAVKSPSEGNKKKLEKHCVIIQRVAESLYVDIKIVSREWRVEFSFQ